MAKSLTNAEKKELAYLLYLKNDMTQKELAGKVGVTEKTIGTWITEGLWAQMKKSLVVSRQEQLTEMYDQLAALNDHIRTGRGFPEKGEADTLSKLASAIRTLETQSNIGQTIEVAMEFTKWLQAEEPLQAKPVTDLFDVFIREKMKKRGAV